MGAELTSKKWLPVVAVLAIVVSGFFVVRSLRDETPATLITEETTAAERIFAAIGEDDRFRGVELRPHVGEGKVVLIGEVPTEADVQALKDLVAQSDVGSAEIVYEVFAVNP